MDQLTHLITRALVGKQPHILLAGIAAAVPFYVTYSPWLVIQGKVGGALRTNDSVTSL